MSIILVLSNHTTIGLGNQINVGILNNIISSNCHARVTHKHRIHGKPGLQLCLQKNHNAPGPSEFVALHLGSDGCH